MGVSSPLEGSVVSHSGSYARRSTAAEDEALGVKATVASCAGRPAWGCRLGPISRWRGELVVDGYRRGLMAIIFALALVSWVLPGTAVAESAAPVGVRPVAEVSLGSSASSTSSSGALTAGWGHACGLQTDGSAVCWGANFAGAGVAAVGAVPGSDRRRVPHVRVADRRFCGLLGGQQWGQSNPWSPLSGSFQALTAGEDFTCGLRTDDSAFCWGTDFN